MKQPKLIVFLLLSLILTSCSSSGSTSNSDISDDLSSTTEAGNGLTAIQYNFGVACDRIRAGVFEGTSDLFREAGTMGEEDGDLDLARIAYEYADALENFDQSETFSECQNY
jgi:hypothetical protein